MPPAVARVHTWLAQLDASDDSGLDGLAEVLRLWLAGAVFDRAAGLAPGWRDTLRHRQQQAALGEMVAALPPLSTRAIAAEIAGQLGRYEMTAWPRDRAHGRRPQGMVGHCFDFLTAGGSVSIETLRKRLSWVTEARALTQASA